jgi:DNA-binding NtrC family response regulator
VRELRNLVESMVVLAPGHEIQPEDLPRAIRDEGSARFLPVAVGPVLRAKGGAEGREMEFIVRSLVELKLQVEELRRRMDAEREERGGLPRGAWLGEVRPPTLGGAAGALGTTPVAVSAGAPAAGQLGAPAAAALGAVGAIEPRDDTPPQNVVTITPGMTMAEIERAAIEAALRTTRGNRRKAAEMLGIGERTMYRKLREYKLDEPAELLD